ncbi:MAG: Polymer-forming cytoskeletal [Actinobacteria bacterium ADurb.Bin346]|nr:MAG: Polymer-forming cytoskeletal [Actinobacteria bacterium ADurb.Bin346]
MKYKNKSVGIGEKMFEKKEMDLPSSKTLTVVAEGVIIEGKLYSRGATRIDGRVTGEIVSEKELVIGKEGKVEATVKTANAIVAGTFKGDMISSGGVEITSTGKFTGKIIQKDALLTVSKGGLFKGESIISDNQDTFKFEFPGTDSSSAKSLPEKDFKETAG